MFGFMKKHSEKDKEEKEKRKKEKREKKESKREKEKQRPLTEDELRRLDEAKKGLLKKSSDIKGISRGIDPQRAGAESGSPYLLGLKERRGSDESSESGSVSSVNKHSPREDTKEPLATSYTTYAQLDVAGKDKGEDFADSYDKRHSNPKRGILKDRSTYGPPIPNHGVVGNLDDTATLEQNTYANEVLSGKIGMEEEKKQDSTDSKDSPTAKVKRRASGSPSQRRPASARARSSPSGSPAQQKAATHKSQSAHNIGQANPKQGNEGQPLPPVEFTVRIQPQQSAEVKSVAKALNPVDDPFNQVDKTFSADLKLPALAPPKPPRAREICLKRQTAGDFGFTLRRGTVLERGIGDNVERKRMVIFAEPGSAVRKSHTGLLPGDRLIEVNGVNVENATREEIIGMIRQSGESVTLKVQPIPELSELSIRSGVDGGEYVLDEDHLKMGTLQRTGSRRYKKAVAKSDAQIESEKEWMSAERVWLVHKGGFAGARVLRANEVTNIAEGRCKVKLDYGGEVLEVDEEDVEKANPPQFDRVEDLANLRYLNESAILHTIRQRYGSNLIHTYSGQSLTVANPMHPLSIYSEKVIQMFKGCKQEDMPPHIYATAQMAYRTMLSSRKDQSIIFMGRSGSGKTTNAKHVLHYLTVTAGTVNSILTVEKLNAMFTLLDAFGNSRTVMNTSATRFTQLTSLDFDHAGQIAAASVQMLMFEKTRIARRPEGEPTFHVFYEMLAGLDSQLRNELQLTDLNEGNLFMTPLQRAEDRQRAAQAWAKIQHAMTLLGVSDLEARAIYSVLAAIYHLGVAGVAKGANNKYQFARPGAAQRAATVLGASLEELSRTIFAPPPTSMSPRASFRGSPSEKSGSPDSLNGMEALEGFVVGLYAEAFNALVALINRSLSSSFRTVSSLLILDSPGFQNPASCGRHSGATFEDLCNNYAQERLQLLFHETTFTSQQDRYAQENIDCDFELVTSTPSAVVALIDKTSQQSLDTFVRTKKEMRDADQRGLLWILDEEALYPGSNEESFLERIFLHHGDEEEKRESLLRHSQKGGYFVLNHFQGTNPVEYNIKGWLRVCRENPLTRMAITFLQESHKEEITAVYTTLRGPVSSTVTGSVVGIEGSSSLRRASSIRRGYTSGAAGLKRKSVCLQVKFQVDSVIELMRRTRMHFVHCLLPQHNAGLCELKNALMAGKNGNGIEDVVVNVPLLRSQIRGCELLEAVRIHRQGFPDYMQFYEFRQRYDLLVPPEAKPAGPITDQKQAVEKMLEHMEIDKVNYRIGLSQVFFRAGSLAQLEDARDEKITGTIMALQSRCRGYLGRQKLQKLKLQNLAVSCIQRNVRKLTMIRSWPWWKLFTRLQPVLNVHRTEEELKDRELEIEQMKMKLEKLEKERNDYKHACDKLENKLSEVSADLSEEHTTSLHATEMLEQETADRMKLEKDFKDLQSKYSTLQRKQEQTEMDLMHARLMSAAVDGEDSEEDDVDGGSIYRQKYEQGKRELEFTKQKFKQQHEEELEQQQALRKQLDRKLTEAVEDGEDQRRQVAQLKRKSQKLTSDMQDTQRHLEEQISRNSDLEKKQRRFDSELNKVNDFLKQEKLMREKTQREKEELSMDKYATEQELRNVKMDYDLQMEKIDRLERELKEMSAAGNKDDKESVVFKRQKAELENKIKDQEEELDEQAGTIQQLEQAKLRLEMSQEKLRQQHQREVEEKDVEMEELRYSTQKKLKQLESQLEEEYEEKQNALREKRELERKMSEMTPQKPLRDRDVEKRLRRDLKRTKSLLQDAQLMLDKHKEGSGNRNVIKQLRNQLEDAEYATAAAVKARKGIEVELQDLQQQLDDISKAKAQVEERCMSLTREKNDLQTKLEDYEEDMADLMKKYKAAVQQQNVEHITIQDQLNQIEELLKEKENLRDQLSQSQSRVEYLQDSTVDKQSLCRLEAKIRDLESRLELEQTNRQRSEQHLARLRDQYEKLSEEQEKLQTSEQQSQEAYKRLQRQLRDVKEEAGEIAKREAEASQRKHDLEKRVESLEADYEQSQADLRLAFKRIQDLQNVIEDDMADSDDSELLSDSEGEDYESDDSMDIESFIIKTRRQSEARQASRHSHSDSGRASRLSLDSSSSSTRHSVTNGDASRYEMLETKKRMNVQAVAGFHESES